METNLHLGFNGTCNDAFALYEKTFGTKRITTMTYGDAPPGTPVPEGMKDKVMHTALRVGTITLMGCDAPPEQEDKMGGFQIAITMPEEAEVKRIFAELSEGGVVRMPAQPTFWSPMFGMLTDKFGVEWMVGVPGPDPA
jgi:PhnB protein